MRQRKNERPEAPAGSGMAAVGVDLGYGAVKVAGPDGRTAQFPAWWAPHAPEAARWGMGSAPRPVTVDGVPVLVGEGAAFRPGARRPFRDGRLCDPDARPLLAAALWRAGAEGPVALGTGMPRRTTRTTIQLRLFRLRRIL